MGAPFSPTVANIYMSIILRKFLQTQPTHPFFIRWYIDDIFIIWTDSSDKLARFLQDLNSFHTSLHFTHQLSHQSIDFLDLTIYKGFTFPFTNLLETKTYQKQLNMYQYLYYTSIHPQKTFKAVIKGECIRYIRTNTSYETYAAMTHCFKKRQLKRNYPSVLIDKTFASVKYSNRPRYLQRCQPKLQAPTPPVYKILPPPLYSLLKKIIVLHEYRNLHFMSPRFIALKHPTLHNKLVRSHIELTLSARN